MISKESTEYIYPLSPMQEGMFFHSLYAADSDAYFEQMSFRLKGELDIKKVHESLKELARRYDVLRTVFTQKALKKIYQIVLKDRSIDFYYEEIDRVKDKKEKEQFIKEFKIKDKQRKFDLQQDVLMRVSIFKLRENEYEFIWSFHHILMDGWCVGILMADFFEIYRSFLRGSRYNPGDAKQYREYIEWLQDQDKEASRQYWQEYLQNYDTLSSLPKKSAGNKSEFEKDRFESVELILTGETTAALKNLSKKYNITLNTLMQTIWGILLGKYNTKNDVVFGTVVSGRPAEIEGIETMVGLFINTVPVRIRYNDDLKFIELLQETHNVTMTTERHHYISLAEIQADNIQGDILDHILVFENYPLAKQIEEPGQQREQDDRPDFAVKNVELFEQSNYDLNVVITPGEQLHIDFLYNCKIYEKEVITGVSKHFEQLIEQIIKNVDLPIKNLSLLSTAERDRVLIEFNNTAAAYPGEKSIPRLFAEEVVKRSGCIAVVHKDSQISYKALHDKTDLLAAVLRRQGVKPGTIVGIMVRRSMEMIIAILSVLKTGGGYLPVDPDYPDNRVDYMLADSDVSHLLTNSTSLEDHAIKRIQGGMTGRGSLKLTAPRAQITELDNLPFPDRSLINYERYSQFIGLTLVKHFFTIQASRGCPFKCAYCHRIWPKNHVFRSAENIFAEVKALYNLGIKRFAFMDDIFNLDVKNSSRFFQLVIEHELDIHLFFPNGMRGDILTKEYIDLMIKAGLTGIALALESASPRIQKLIGKNLNLKRFRENIEYIASTYPGIILELFVMVGFPTETGAEAMLTLDFIKSIRWIDFPIVSILKIYPNTAMETIALENGISYETIIRSQNQAYHEIPDTIPFDKEFMLQFQTDYLHNYFVLKERLLDVLPAQMKLLTEDEIIQKYNSYLPVAIKSFADLLDFTGIKKEELQAAGFLDEERVAVPNLDEKIHEIFPAEETPAENALRVLLLDLSQLFSGESDMLYDVVEAPLGLIYLLTYLNKQLGSRVNGKIAKSRLDFNSFAELKTLIKDFNPRVIGIRTLTFFKDFFHQAVATIRNWGFKGAIIAGGPYATSDYENILQDAGVNLVVLGEGEETFTELVTHILQNNGELPAGEALEQINGIAYNPAVKSAGKEAQVKTVSLDFDHIAALKPGSEKREMSRIQPGDVGYVMYTSGSTGQPKGVMVTHKNAVRLVKNTNFVPLSADTRILLTGAPVFDSTTFEIWGSLLNGGQLVLVDNDTILDFDEFAAQLLRHNINTLWLSSPLFNQMVKQNPAMFAGLKYLLVGGDELYPEFINMVREKYPALEIINGYGPTENTTFSACFIVDKDYPEKIPIGPPINNSTAYVVDKNGNPQPPNVPGELWVGGDGVSRGYLNNPELTAEKFVDLASGGQGALFEKTAPWTPAKTFISESVVGARRAVPGEIFYKTGDRARWLGGGCLEFLGRMDYQIKIRGFRVELGEIENHLRDIEGVHDALVTVKEEDDGDKFISAYLVLNKNGAKEPGTKAIPAIKEKLTQTLPDYMIPSYFVELEKIPLTQNGKIDRKALPDPRAGVAEEYIPPRTPAEKKMVKIWAEVLNLSEEMVSINKSFLDLGGHSLKITILISRIVKEFDVKIPIAEVFKRKTVTGLCDFMKHTEESKFTAVNPTEKKEYYPLSSVQNRMFFLQQVELQNVSYNIFHRVQLAGKYEKEYLQEICTQLIHRHESLRTSFFMLAGTLVQRIAEKVDFNIEYYRLRGSNIEQQVENTADNFIRPFDLSNAPLLRIGVINREKEADILLIDMHHIISDGISQDILEKEFADSLNKAELRPLRLQYKDYTVWQSSKDRNKLIENQKKYWLNTLTGELPVLNLPCDYQRPLVRSYAGANLSFRLGEEQTRQLNQIGNNNDSTLHMVLTAVFNILLAKLSGQEDILSGIPVANRRHVDLENVIGMFVNTLVLRSKPVGSMSFKEFLQTVNETTLAGFENQDYPFEDLVDTVLKDRDSSRNPLFDVMFVLQNQFEKSRNVSYPGDKMVFTEEGIAKFDLTVICVEIGNYLLCEFEYYAKLFKRESVERFIAYFKNIIAAVIRNPGVKLSQIEILPEEEKKQLLFTFNDTAAGYPQDKVVREMVAETAARRPDFVAVVEVDRAVTYRELDQNADRLAGLLKNMAVKADTTAGILIDPSVEMITGMLAVLKAGGAYLPLDLLYPPERIKYMLADSGAGVVLTSRALDKHVDRLRSLQVETVFIEEGRGEAFPFCPGSECFAPTCVRPAGDSGVGVRRAVPSEPATCSLQPVTSSSHLVYIIYTSGITGFPKGVLVEHKGLVNLIYYHRKIFKENNRSRMSQAASIGFDAMAFETWPCLTVGACLILAGSEERVNPKQMRKWLIKQCVTISFQATFTAEQLLAEEWPPAGRALQCLRTAGDKLSKYPELAYPFRFYNLYGPTEDTIWTTWTEVETGTARNGSPGIGKPVANHYIYIPSAGMKLQPVGIPGELCISGQGITRGYLNRVELTADKFVNNPFEEGEKLYRTGDMARWQQDGGIEFLGRVDHQVKIRGYRIEPGEIESRLLQVDGIKEAFVIDKEDESGRKYLCAYIVPREVQDNPAGERTGIDTAAVREKLSGTLPAFMIPTYFVELNEVPLTANGKLDRRALPGHEAAVKGSGQYEGPRDEIEEGIIKIWSEVLELEIIGIKDNFFEIGGNSVKILRVSEKLNEFLKRNIPVTLMFQYPTIASLSDYLKRESSLRPVNPGKKKEEDLNEVAHVSDRLKQRRQRAG